MIYYYTPTTETEVMQYLNVQKDELFWTRIDVGIEYLTMRHGRQYAEYAAREPWFWHWMLRIWETGDKRFLMLVRRFDYDLEMYKEHHRAHMLKYKTTERNSNKLSHQI